MAITFLTNFYFDSFTEGMYLSHYFLVRIIFLDYIENWKICIAHAI